MTPQELAKKLLEFYDGKPSRWTKGWFAKNKFGNDTNAVASDACRWCAHGAIQKLESTLEENPFGDAYDGLCRLLASENRTVDRCRALPPINDSFESFAEFEAALKRVAG